MATTPASTTANKRARSNAQAASGAPAPNPDDGGGDDDGDDDDEGAEPDSDAQAGDKRKMRDAESLKNHPLNRPGRHTGRTVEAFGRFLPMLEFGMHVEDMESQNTPLDCADMSDEERQWDAQYRAIDVLVPGMRAWIDEIGVISVAQHLTTARKNARGEDAKRVKDSLHAMHFWVPTLVGLPKDRRGMHHEEIAGLIVPPHDRHLVTSNDAAVAQQARHEYIHYQRHLDPELWPAFLYRNFRIYEHNVWRGLLKSDLLVSIARLLFFGPRSLTPGAPVGGVCNAVLNHMHEMTIGALCYVATLGFFALSSDTEFRPVPSLGGFCYKAFYDDLKQRLEKEAPERIEALLSWWNARMFTQQHQLVVNRPPGIKSTAELLAEQGAQDDDNLE